MVQEKAFAIKLFGNGNQIFASRVKVDSYTKPTMPDDLIKSRTTLFRAIEKGMEAYAMHCTVNGEKMQEIHTVVATYLGVVEK